MIPFDVQKAYQETYLYYGSSLVEGSIQDTELRKAWHAGMWTLLHWMLQATEDDPDVDVFAKLEEVMRQLDSYMIANTSLGKTV